MVGIIYFLDMNVVLTVNINYNLVSIDSVKRSSVEI